MPFITTPERVGRRKGMRIGIQTILEAKFGTEGLGLMPEVDEVYGEDQLQAIVMILVTAVDLVEARRFISSLKP